MTTDSTHSTNASEGGGGCCRDDTKKAQSVTCDLTVSLNVVSP